jgi:hypothetical protein
MMLVVTSPWQWYIAFLMEESRVLSKRSKSQLHECLECTLSWAYRLRRGGVVVRAIKIGRDDQPVRE